MNSRPPESTWLVLLPASLRQWFEHRRALDAVIGNSVWLMFDKLVRLALSVAVGAWVARYLGPAHFGELAFALAFIAFFQGAAGVGLDGIVVRDLARNRNDAPVILGTTVWLRLFAGLFVWVLALAGIALLRPGDGQALALVAIIGGGLVIQAADTIDLWFQSQSLSRRTVGAKLVSYLVSNGLRVALILSQAPLTAFAWVVLLESLAAAAALVLSYRRHPIRERWTASLALAKALVSQSWPLMLAGVAVMAYMRIDQIMLREMLGERELGLYSAALLISQVWHVIPMTLAPSLAPYVAQKKSRDENEYRNALVAIFRAFLILALLVSVATALAAPMLVAGLYGAQYRASAQVLSIHVFSNVFVFLGVAHSLWVINENRPGVRFWGTVLAGLCAVSANYLVIPRFGLEGVAVVAVVTQFIAAVGINALLARESLVMQMRAVGLKLPG